MSRNEWETRAQAARRYGRPIAEIAYDKARAARHARLEQDWQRDQDVLNNG